jgi:3-hydroxyisobutyrate dehydrogenase-like beta-hydroxyacid dehydrogenase
MAETNKTEAVSVLGLGAMGAALARALLAAGHPTTVWNRTATRAAPLADQGAAVAGSPGEAMAASPLVVLCLLDHASVVEVLGAAGGFVAGRTVVDLTSGTPDEARDTARLVAAAGGEHVDGGIMAIPPMIGRPEAVVLYSGPRVAFDRHAATLGVLGTARYLDEDPGRAALVDLALLSGMYGLMGGFLHAAALARAGGVRATELMEHLGPWLAAMGGELPRFAERVDSGEHGGDDVGSNLAMQATGVGTLLRAGEEHGISDALLAPLHALMVRRVADGHGDEDLTGVVELLRE